ncbi:MAG: rane protein [Adhaeribacter sp.]|jgi:integral membrane protein|nr:rane protein [Adhaeribacter sp.]
MNVNTPTQAKPALDRFRLIAVLEGISYLVLLLIAMPLKYLADMPLMVKYVGWAHGVLFVLYGLALLQVWMVYRWSFLRVVWAFILSFIPLGTFWLDRQLRREG